MCVGLGVGPRPWPSSMRCGADFGVNRGGKAMIGACHSVDRLPQVFHSGTPDCLDLRGRASGARSALLREARSRAIEGLAKHGVRLGTSTAVRRVARRLSVSWSVTGTRNPAISTLG